MARGLPTNAKTDAPGKTVSVDLATYFLATRMEKAGRLNRGQALMLSATLSNTQAKPKKGKRS